MALFALEMTHFRREEVMGHGLCILSFVSQNKFIDLEAHIVEHLNNISSSIALDNTHENLAQFILRRGRAQVSAQYYILPTKLTPGSHFLLFKCVFLREKRSWAMVSVFLTLCERINS